MAKLECKKADLRRFLLETSDVHSDSELAILVRRNRQFSGYVYDLLEGFMRLGLQEKLLALSQTEFRGMHWQRPRQAHPYV